MTRTYPPFPIDPKYSVPYVSADTALANAQLHAAAEGDAHRLDWIPDRIETNIWGRDEFITEFGLEAWEHEMEPLLLESLARRLGCVR
jgi:hypothetical protein